MYRIHAMVLLGLFATGIAGVPAGQPTTGCGGFSELQRVEVADANELEVVMGLIKRPADSIGAKHYHPSGEFGFILKGGVTVETEHEPKCNPQSRRQLLSTAGGNGTSSALRPKAPKLSCFESSRRDNPWSSQSTSGPVRGLD